jgi:Probable cobalt transporter subunit (CbtB)
MPKAAAGQISAPPISRRLLWIALIVTAALLLVAYLVAFDQGAVSQSGMYLHELMHDGRHLLGVPCH